MGDVTRILVTGANGFVGRAVVEEALSRGFEVTAIHRRAAQRWKNRKGLRLVRCDLSDGGAVTVLKSALGGVDAVIHAAAHLGDAPGLHLRDTLAATQHVLKALEGRDTRFVLVGSIAVYDTDAIPAGSALTEDSPLISTSEPRDPYAGAKIAQESLVRASGRPAWILRPGAVWGRGRTWHALNGPKLGKLFLTVGSSGELPLAHVSSTARALVQAAVTPTSAMTAVNVFDDDRPTRQRFVKAHKQIAGWPRLTATVPWPVWLGLCRAASVWPGRPGLLQSSVARARLMPLSYPNTRLRELFGGQDRAPFERLLEASVGGGAG